MSSRAVAGRSVRSPLAQLLHALNQPLTGLQCSMEVALAGPRTPEQYVQGLHEGLELSGRMRLLVEAIREVVDIGEASENDLTKNDELQPAELRAVLQEVADDLEPVAEVKGVRIRIALDRTAGSLPPQTGSPQTTSSETISSQTWRRQRINSTMFRLLDSALSLAARGTELQIGAGEQWFRVRWRGGKGASTVSPPELGLLVAQAGLERAGALWERERTEESETVTVRLPNA